MTENGELHELRQRLRHQLAVATAAVDPPETLPHPRQSTEIVAPVMRGGAPSADTVADSNYFDRNTEMRPEVIEGLVREGQLLTFAGPYGVGKTPVEIDLMIALINGLEWCGRGTQRRPVIVFDLESAAPAYKLAVRNGCRRRHVSLPTPEVLEPYLQNDSADETNTMKLLKALATRHTTLVLLAECLNAKPNAVVFMDPIELLFRVDTRDKMQVLTLYRELRLILTGFPRAVLWSTFNLRKRDRRADHAPCLFTEPRTWLEEVSGSLDILNRSDVRLGMDFYGEGVRVINGVRRSEEMDPFLLRSVGDKPDELSGFEICLPDAIEMKFALSSKQLAHWQKLPPKFRFDEAVELVPRASLWRLITRGKSLGLIEHDEATGVYRKQEPKRETRTAD